MKDGNGESEANGITQFAEGEPKRLSRTRTRMSRLAAVPCRTAGTRKKLFRRRTPPTHWIAAVSAAEEKTHAEPRRRGGSLRRMQKMKGGNGESEANEVTLP